VEQEPVVVPVAFEQEAVEQAAVPEVVELEIFGPVTVELLEVEFERRHEEELVGEGPQLHAGEVTERIWAEEEPLAGEGTKDNPRGGEHNMEESRNWQEDKAVWEEKAFWEEKVF